MRTRTTAQGSKRLLLTLAMLAVCVAVVAAVTFTDDFNRADSDSLGANWVEDAGDTDILTNAIFNSSGGFTLTYARYASSLASANQYFKFTVANLVGVSYIGAALRYTDSSSPFYVVTTLTSDSVYWWYLSNLADGTPDEIATASLTVDAADVIGITLDGTGTSTVVRIWRNPTGLPTSASDWNGDNTPDVTFTNDPASAVDTGNNVAMFNGSADGGGQDDVFLGDIPTGAAATVRGLLLGVLP